MRQLTVAFISLLFSFQAFAFHDQVTVNNIEKLKQKLEAAPREGRLETLEKFKNFMFKRLNTIEMPEDILNTPDTDPRMEEYRSLTEFSGYLNLIAPKTLTAASCQSAQLDIANSSKTQGDEALEANEAAKILASLCK